MANDTSRAILAGVPGDDANDPLLEVLWTRVLEGWEDDQAHASLLEHALRVHALPEIAGRYRALVDDREKGQAAKRQLDRIVVAATQLLFSMKTPKPGKVPVPITLSAFGVCLLMLAWLAFAVWGKH
jgi:hypothetical protein